MSKVASPRSIRTRTGKRTDIQQTIHMTDSTDFSELTSLARRGRWHVLQTVSASGAGHVGGPMSAMDLLIALFFRVMAVRPEEPHWPDRDRFIMSKGHAAIGLYTAMALRGFFPVEELKTFDKGNSRLQGHPDMTKLPGVETSTGSLGMGLSVGRNWAGRSAGSVVRSRPSGGPARPGLARSRNQWSRFWRNHPSTAINKGSRPDRATNHHSRSYGEGERTLIHRGKI